MEYVSSNETGNVIIIRERLFTKFYILLTMCHIVSGCHPESVDFITDVTPFYTFIPRYFILRF